MPRLHVSAPKPSPLLAVIALAIVHRLHPQWVCVPLVEASAGQGISPQRLSRLCSKAITLFDAIVGNLTRRGRPKAAEHNNDVELAQARALLGVATTILQAVPLRGRKIRALLVGAWLRLQQSSPTITHRCYCATLGISERAFRRWRNDTTEREAEKELVEPAPNPSPSKPPALRRGRFNFGAMLPETQFAADTTDLCVFGTKLKLVASQDVGDRNNSLLDSVIIDSHESAAHVEQVLRESLTGLEGAQAITDQGTPYLAQATRQALDEMLVDHAPQREGDPLGKATIERAFGTVKTIAAPLFALTNRLADTFSVLKEDAFAKAFARLIITLLLRAYQAGARATRREEQQRGGVDEKTLARLAAENRDKARAELRSKRMLLEYIHHAFSMPRSKTAFIRQFRSRPLAVIKSAQKDFGKQAHRDDIRDRAAYFAKLVNNHLDVYLKQQATRQKQQQGEQQRTVDEQQKARRDQDWNEHPHRWLLHALKTIAAFWISERCTFIAGGAGPGMAWLRGSLNRLVEIHGVRAAFDIAHGTADVFGRNAVKEIGDKGTCAVLDLLFDEIGRTTPHMDKMDSQKVAEKFTAAILARDGP